MVATPDAKYTTTVWEAALSAPEHGSEILEMVAKSNVLLKFMLNAELELMRGYKSRTGKAATKLNGYERQHFTYSSLSAIQRQLKVAQMATSAAIAMSAGVTTSVDLSLPTNALRVLTGDYGVVWGAMTWGLEEAIRGSAGGKNIHEWIPIVRRDIAQTISDTLNTGMYSDGTTNKIDGLDYWFKITGTKWNSQDINTTDTFLQGQTFSCTEAQYTKERLRKWIDHAFYGTISGTRSEGLKPNLALVSTNLVRLMKGWVDDKQSIQLTPQMMNQEKQAANNNFVQLGSPQDYVMFDGVCFVPDRYIDDNMSSNVGKGYLFNASDLELITHKDFGFDGTDAEKMGGQAPTKLEAYTIPGKLYKHGLKQIILINMFHKRPRNTVKFTVTA